MVRLLIFLFFFLNALLTVFPAPTHLLWYASIIINEFPWIFIAVVLLLLFIRFGPARFEGYCIALGIGSLLLFLYPIIGAYGVSKNIDRNLTNAFNPVIPKERNIEYPFGFWKMFQHPAGSRYAGHMIRFPSADTTLDMEFFPVTDTGAKPCVVIVHGGSWAGGESDDLSELSGYLAAKGYPVAAINYRLAPAHRFPSPVVDLCSALRFLRAHSVSLHIDTTHFFLLGRSAGGQIALTAAYLLRQEGISGVIDYYGPTDMLNAYDHPSKKAVIDSRQVIQDYLGGDTAQAKMQYQLASPVAWVNPHSVPTLIIHGRHDPVVSFTQALLLARKLSQNHVRHYLVELPWGTHGFDYSIRGPSGQLSTYAVRRFIDAVVHPADTVIVQTIEK